MVVSHSSTISDRDRAWPLALGIAIALAVGLRVAAMFALSPPLESDALSYFTMARNLAEHGNLVDNYGLHAFFSAGYPLLLAPAFALFGSSIAVALAVNLVLAAVSALLIFRIALLVAGKPTTALLASFGYAIWLPSIGNAASVMKENLTTPLLLAVTLLSLQAIRTASPWRIAFVGGLLWGASVIAGGSALLVCAGMAAALVIVWRREGSGTPALRAGAGFCLGAALVIAPWLTATNRMVGAPVLTTNAAFNLYIGNNPAANGWFVSMAETPLGPGYNERRLAMGELRTAEFLKARAVDWIIENPRRAAELAALKLVYFWAPNVPDETDFAQSKAVSLIRLIALVQYCAILALALWAFCRSRIGQADKWVCLTIIASFWLIHAGAYIIPRYRDPAVALLIAFAAIPASGWLYAKQQRTALHAA